MTFLIKTKLSYIEKLNMRQKEANYYGSSFFALFLGKFVDLCKRITIDFSEMVFFTLDRFIKLY